MSLDLVSLWSTLKAKRGADTSFWRAVFATKDAVDLARRRRERGRRQRAELVVEVEGYRQRPALRQPRREDFHLRSAVLRTHEEAAAAIAEVRALGLRPHDSTDRKNWDSLAALSAILKTTTRDAWILDAGAALKSKILPWLSAYGYKNLIGINLSFRSAVRIGDIVYQHGDLTRTSFPNGCFDAIACISVVEHGVDMRSCFQEMSRILKPNGLLTMSTDYWPNRVDTSDVTAFDAAWTIFDRGDILRIVDTGAHHGFALDGELKLDARDRVVAWNGREYTFIYLALRKTCAA